MYDHLICHVFFLKQISHMFLIDIKYEIHSMYLINCFQGKFLA
jgi:hypothetical protein